MNIFKRSHKQENKLDKSIIDKSIMSKSLFKNTFFKGILSLFNIIIPLLITPYVYRILSPNIIGHIEYGTTLYTYFGLFGALGIYNYGLREISKYRNNKKKVISIYRDLFNIGIVSNCFVLIFYYICICIFPSETTLKFILLIMGGNLVANIFYVEWLNEAFEEFKFITIKTIIIRIISIIFIFLLVKSPLDYITYVIIITAVVFINNIISFIYIQQKLHINIFQPLQNINWRLYLPPLFFILILNNSNLLYTMLDRTMLGNFSTMDEVAFYSVGQKITEIIKGLVMTLVFVSLPRLAYYYEEAPDNYKNNIKKLIRTMLMIILPTSIGIILLSKEIIILFAGQSYLSAVPALKVFGFRLIILAIEAILTQQIIFLHGKERILVILNLICGGINLVLSFILLNHLTPTLAITTTVFAECCFLATCLWYIKSKLHLNTGLWQKGNLKYIILSLLFIPIVLLLHKFIHSIYWFVFLAMTSCTIVYVIGLWQTKDIIFIEIINRVQNKEVR